MAAGIWSIRAGKIATPTRTGRQPGETPDYGSRWKPQPTADTGRRARKEIKHMTTEYTKAIEILNREKAAGAKLQGEIRNHMGNEKVNTHYIIHYAGTDENNGHIMFKSAADFHQAVDALKIKYSSITI